MQAAHKRNETLLAHAQEQDFPTWIAWGMALRGWILATQGQAERGMAQVRQVLPLEHAASVPSWPFALVRAEVYRVSGYAGEGLRLLAEALAVVDKTDVRDFEAEIYRLRGELLLAQSADNYAEAETCLSRALALARRQQAKAWELRASHESEPPLAIAGQAGGRSAASGRSL